MSEEILLFDRLYLAASAVEVSQPLPVGSANQIEIHAWIESGIAITSPAPVVQLQTSPDMDNFADKSGFNVTLYSAPGSDTRGSGGSYDQLTGNLEIATGERAALMDLLRNERAITIDTEVPNLVLRR